jgi:hypothetical protein
MSRFSEQEPIDPDDPELDYSPIRLSERAAKLGPTVSQRVRSDPITPSAASRSAALAPKATNEPARRTRDPGRRAALLSVAARIASVAGAMAVVALLFLIMKPASRQSVAISTPSDTTDSTPQSNRADATKPALAEVKAPAESPPGQPAAHKQAQELLLGFLQWREKVGTAGMSAQPR